MVWKWEISFPSLNHFRVIFRGEKPKDLQVKFAFCSDLTLPPGPSTTGGEGLARGAFIDKRYDCEGQAKAVMV